MNLDDIKKIPLPHKRRKRVGRGNASGKGKTSARGHKGAKSRSGYSRNLAGDGGQMPLFRKIPKRGFNNNRFRREWTVVNLRDLARAGFADGEEVSIESLAERGLVKQVRHGVKLLGVGEVTARLEVRVHRISEAARKKVEAAGGSVELV